MKVSREMARVINRIAKANGVDITKPGAYIKLENEPYMPLSIENIGWNQLAIAHRFEQNGDLMADPEVVMYIGYGAEDWVPVEITQHPVGAYRKVTWLTADGKSVEKFAPRAQREVGEFANMWAKNIRRQGFVKATAVRIKGGYDD